jgi:hypothetical protein
MRVTLLVSVTLALSTTAFAQALSDAQIRQALVGKTISGTENGEAYSEYLNPDGVISGRSSSGAYSGRWRISDNEICFLYEEDAGRGGKWDCNEVRLRGNQIIWDDNSTATVSGAIIGGVLGGGGAPIGAIIGGATGAAIGAQGEPRPAGYRYYQDACYQPQPDGGWLAVSPKDCALAPAAQDSSGTAVIPGNHELPGVQSPGTTGTGAAGTKTGTSNNTATLPGNHALPGVQRHGGTATGTGTAMGNSAGSPHHTGLKTAAAYRVNALHKPSAVLIRRAPPSRVAAPAPPRPGGS